VKKRRKKERQKEKNIEKEDEGDNKIDSMDKDVCTRHSTLAMMGKEHCI
jgi:hypothetical protein